MRLRKILAYTLLAVAVAAAAAYALRAPLAVALAKRVAAARLGADPIAELADGLHVGLCGAGSPFPDEKRSGPCTLIVAGKRLFVFDAGSGAARNIGRMGFNHGRIEAIFLTHFHSDHMDGLGELLLQRWVSVGNAAPPPVYGPAGVETLIAGIAQSYAMDRGYRVAHHGDAIVPGSGFGGSARPFDLGPQGRVVVLKDADLEIVAFAVDHGPVQPTVGYRIVYKGRSVVLSGDTKKSASVQREAAGVDLLLHEALSTPLMAVFSAAAAQAGRANLAQVFTDVMNYHSSPEEAAEIARDGKVGYLVFNHIVPPLPLPGMEAAFVGNSPAIFSGPTRVGTDGDFFSLPTGSSAIQAGARF